jgi:hypothetical protein
MVTNLAIDPDLLDRALQVSGERTRKAAVTKALQEFISRREQRRVLELMGKLGRRRRRRDGGTRPSALRSRPACAPAPS